MAREELICGLDIGSSQITCVVGKTDAYKDSIEVVSSSRIACRGVIGGVVVNINETALGVKKVIEEAEEKIDAMIHDVYLGIRGSHVETVNNKGVHAILRTDKEITAEDVTSVIENAKAIPMSSDRVIIDTIPQQFQIDRQKGVHDPTGMEGNHLEVNIHIITASSTTLNNIYKSVAQAGFSIIEPPVYGLVAVGNVVVTNEEKELGCLMVDLGGQTTGLVFYGENCIKSSKELTIGCDLITKDISHGLKTSLLQAKEIKERHGVAFPSMLKGNENIDYIGVDGRIMKTTNRKELAEYIAPRLEELFEKISEEIENQDITPPGIILTGGGSMLEGIDKACEKVTGIETRLGLPQGIRGPNEITSNPAFATAIGLLKYSPGQEETRRPGMKSISRMPMWRKLRDMFK
ncbi:MAG: cell division protein FtsA [Elusimicrobiota bacterium]|nr:cell division protein FtsA [Elusimicrobiota bacterium]